MRVGVIYLVEQAQLSQFRDPQHGNETQQDVKGSGSLGAHHRKYLYISRTQAINRGYREENKK